MGRSISSRIHCAALSLCVLAACSTHGPSRYGSPTRHIISQRDVEREATPFIEVSKSSAEQRPLNVRLAEQPFCNNEQTLYDEIPMQTSHEFDWDYVKIPMLLLGAVGSIGGAARGDVGSAPSVALWGGGLGLLFVALALPNDSSYSYEYSTTQSEPYTRLGLETYACGSPRAYTGATHALDVSVTTEGDLGFGFRLPLTEHMEFPSAKLRGSFAYWAKTCEVGTARVEFSSRQAEKKAATQLTFTNLPTKVARSGKLTAALQRGDQCLKQRRQRFAARCWETAKSKHAAACETQCVQSKGGDLCAFDKSDCSSLGRSASDCAEVYERCLDKLGMGSNLRGQCIDKCVATELGTRCEDEWLLASPVKSSTPTSTLSAGPLPDL